MQTPKSRPSSLDVPQKPSPGTPRTSRKLKSDSDSFPSPNPMSKTPKDRSPKVVDRRSPRSPAIERKRSSRVPELEAQLAQLQTELKKAKDQLSSSESWKLKAQQEAEEAKKQLAAMSAKLQETQKQLCEFSDSEESRIQELRKISQDRDREWQSELEAVQKQHTMDSTALSNALNEIQRLKIQLNRVTESEVAQARHAESAHGEIRGLRVELTETLELVEKLKNQLNDSRESENRAMEEVVRAQKLLEAVKNTEETLRSERDDAVGSYESLLAELDESKNQIQSLEELVGSLQAVLAEKKNVGNTSDEQSEKLRNEINSLKNEAIELRTALEVAEKRYHDQCLESEMQNRNAHELVDRAKLESSRKEAEMQADLKQSMAEIEELKFKLGEKDNTPFQNNENELENSRSLLEDLKASLLDKETKLKRITEENEMLKSQIKEIETNRNKENDEAIESARVSEHEALAKLGYLTEEADKSSRKAERIAEELDAAQAANSEMEAELRRLKVQSDQWRKAAEAAAAMLSGGNNSKYVERTGSMDYHTIGGKMGSPYTEDMEDDSPKKKNGNMLKKIGVLLKKGQK